MDKKTFNIHNLDLYSLSKDLLYGLRIPMNHSIAVQLYM